MRVMNGGKRRYKRRRIKTKSILIILAILLLLLACAAIYILNTYKIKTVYVEGNVHYTEDEIKQIVMAGRFGDNSLYLSLKYSNREITDIPFVETMDVTIMSPDTIKIHVYEKALAGCIEHLGVYIYFDKDGIVVETSSQITEGIPVVTGISFRQVILNQRLPADDEDIFLTILDLTKLMDKYQVYADYINFNSLNNITLLYDNIRVNLGKAEYLDEKIMELPYILPSLSGESGVLKMENYSDPSQDITFVKDS